MASDEKAAELAHREWLEQFGISYYAGADIFDVVERKSRAFIEAQYATSMSPCGALMFFHDPQTHEIVCLRIISMVRMLVAFDMSPIELTHTTALLGVAQEWLAVWVERGLAINEMEIAQAHKKFKEARDFLLSCSSGTVIPDRVHQKIIGAWRKKSSPSASLH